MSVGIPPQADSFELLEKDGVAIYIAPSLLKKAGSRLTITLEGLWVFKELEVSGFKP